MTDDAVDLFVPLTKMLKCRSPHDCTTLCCSCGATHVSVELSTNTAIAEPIPKSHVKFSKGVRPSTFTITAVPPLLSMTVGDKTRIPNKLTKATTVVIDVWAHTKAYRAAEFTLMDETVGLFARNI